MGGRLTTELPGTCCLSGCETTLDGRPFFCEYHWSLVTKEERWLLFRFFKRSKKKFNQVLDEIIERLKLR